MRRRLFSGSAVAFLALVWGCAEPQSSSSIRPWNPDRADLLFYSNHEGNGEIYLLAAGTEEWVNLTEHPAGDNWPQWSPDGGRIAFQSNRNGNLDVFVMDADGTNVVQLTDDPAHDYLPAWSPDGKRIAFVSWRIEPGDDEENPANHVYIMNADGSDPARLLPDSPGTSAGVTWSPDGRFMLLARKISEQPPDVFVLDATGQIVRRLTDDSAANGAAIFSPDGKQVAFYSDSGAASKLVVINVDGTVRREFATTGQNWYPAWSPDGRWLVYTAANPDGGEDDLDVMALPLDGLAAPVIMAGGPGRQAEGQWRPAGS